MEGHAKALAVLEREVRLRAQLPPAAERRAIRLRALMPLKAVARAVGVTAETIRTWEAGEHDPRPQHVETYLAALRVLGGTPLETTDTPTADKLVNPVTRANPGSAQNCVERRSIAEADDGA